MVTIKRKGDWSKTDKFLEKALNVVKLGTLDKYGRQGVEVLSSATPRDTGKTAESWYYEIHRKNGNVTINWCNSNINDGYVVAVLIQYGHAFQNGAYVDGTDYINPAMKHAFDNIADSIWKELISK